ncbi:hypothetical protein AB0M54_47720 [Actinoplanes sp. NPDC051470]|uniref:hypothetical protein n=1 Tax=Actinoplanes sp. NPDC051470 TaxID=3157224 RepID=UPI00343D4087
MTGDEEPRQVPIDELFAHLAETDPTLQARAVRAEVNEEERLQAIIAAQAGEPGTFRNQHWFDRPPGHDNLN